MGQFSWLDCVDGKQIIDNYEKTSYVLVPREFGGGHIATGRYDGYGHFGGYDIYELVAEWNKEYIPQYVKLMKAGKWECDPYTSDIDDLMAYYNDQPLDVELRNLGITLACYDEDNARLKYPIKITYHPDVTYEECKPSPSDPDQGWGTPDELKSSKAWIDLSAEFSRDAWNRVAVISAIKKVFTSNGYNSPKVTSRNYERDRQPDTYPEDIYKNIFIEYVGSITFEDCEDLIYDLSNAISSVGGDLTDHWIDTN